MPDIENFEDLIQKLKDHEKRIVMLEKSIAKGIESEKLEKKMSIQEYIRSKELKTGVDKTLAIGYFMEKYENLENYNKIDIEDHFKKAKEKPPLNINDKVNSNIKKGYMMEVDEKKNSLKCWSLTNSGIEFCENDYKKE